MGQEWAMKHGRKNGFTLIELMVVVAIVAILAAVTYPSYTSYVKRTNRVDMQAHLTGLAQQLANYKLLNRNYDGATLTALGGSQFPTTGTAKYQIVLTDISGKLLSEATADKQTWLLVARPSSTGSQKSTGAVSLDSSNNQCWYKDKDDAKVTAALDTDGKPIAADICPNKWTDR